MKDNAFQSNSVWNDAARSGLVLGLISIAYMVANSLMGKIEASGAGAAVINVAGILLWVFKLYICIKLMKTFMLKFAEDRDDVTNRDTFRFGTATALLSALLYAGFSLAWMLFVQPDSLNEAMGASMEIYENYMTEDQLSSIQELLPKLPTIIFFINLIWCWLFGTILAAIFSSKIPPRNPFAEVNKTDNE